MTFPWLAKLRTLHPGRNRALFLAVQERNIEQASAWLDAVADPDAVFNLRRPVNTTIATNALVLALEWNHLALVSLLLERGANPEISTTTNSPVGQWLVALTKTPYMTPDQKKIGMLLLGAGADLNKALGSKSNAVLHGVLQDTGRLDAVYQLELQHLANEAASSIDAATPPARVPRRRIGL